MSKLSSNLTVTTVDNMHHKITSKINWLRECINTYFSQQSNSNLLSTIKDCKEEKNDKKYKQYKLLHLHQFDSKKMLDNITKLKNDYIGMALDVIIKYMDVSENTYGFSTNSLSSSNSLSGNGNNDIKSKIKYSKDYISIINSLGIISTLDGMHSKLVDILSRAGIWNEDDKKIYRLQEMWNDTKLTIEVNTLDYNICNVCGGNFIVLAKTSELMCKGCDLVIQLKGTLFEENNFYSQETGCITNKKSNHDIQKHCEHHLSRILSSGKIDIPDEVWENIYKWIETQNLSKRKSSITFKQYRRCLKDINATTYNEYISYIRRKVGNIKPVELLPNEIDTLYVMFRDVVNAFKKVKEGKANMRYYPFFIMKILEYIMCYSKDATNDSYERFIDFCKNIHFQSKETTKNNDEIWEEICKSIKIPFKKTNINLLQE